MAAVQGAPLALAVAEKAVKKAQEKRGGGGAAEDGLDLAEVVREQYRRLGWAGEQAGKKTGEKTGADEGGVGKDGVEMVVEQKVVRGDLWVLRLGLDLFNLGARGRAGAGGDAGGGEAKGVTRANERAEALVGGGGRAEKG